MDSVENTPSRSVSLKHTKGEFPLLVSLVLGVCLVVLLVRDPADISALQKELDQARSLHDQQVVSANQQISSLQQTVLYLQSELKQTQDSLSDAQQTLGRIQRAALDLQRELSETQQALLAAQEALGDARDEISMRRSAGPSIVEKPPPVVAESGAAKEDPAMSAPETPAERQARIRKEYESVQRALRQNADEYIGLTRALAETRRSLAYARGQASTEARGHHLSAGAALADWPLDWFLSDAEFAASEAASPNLASAPPDDEVSLIRGIAALNRTLVAVQESISAGQRMLSALQEELRAALAR